MVVAKEQRASRLGQVCRCTWRPFQNSARAWHWADAGSSKKPQASLEVDRPSRNGEMTAAAQSTNEEGDHVPTKISDSAPSEYRAWFVWRDPDHTLTRRNSVRRACGLLVSSKPLANCRNETAKKTEEERDDGGVCWYQPWVAAGCDFPPASAPAQGPSGAATVGERKWRWASEGRARSGKSAGIREGDTSDRRAQRRLARQAPALAEVTAQRQRCARRKTKILGDQFTGRHITCSPPLPTPWRRVLGLLLRASRRPMAPVSGRARSQTRRATVKCEDHRRLHYAFHSRWRRHVATRALAGNAIVVVMHTKTSTSISAVTRRSGYFFMEFDLAVPSHPIITRSSTDDY